MAPSADSPSLSSTSDIEFTSFSNVINGRLSSASKTTHAINPATKKPNWEVPISTSQDVDEAVAAAKEHNPTLVLADIQLADDSSGIDAVKDILSEISVPVIFITAFPERLLTGERPEPTFLITKPFQRSTVKAAISQALFFDQATAPA